MDTPHCNGPMLFYFTNVEILRREHSTTLHALEAILLITILGTICRAHNWVEIEQWDEARPAWLREFLELPHGSPSRDPFGRVLALLDPESLHQAFLAWMSTLAQLGPEFIALDSQTIRHSLDRADGKDPMQVVSAWESRHERVRVPFKVDARIHAITARLDLLARLDLDSSVVTIDAMGCQVEIARAILDPEGDYVLNLQENQPGLYEDCAELFT